MCTHQKDSKTVKYNHILCNDCGSIKLDSNEYWGDFKCQWFLNKAEAVKVLNAHGINEKIR